MESFLLLPPVLEISSNLWVQFPLTVLSKLHMQGHVTKNCIGSDGHEIYIDSSSFVAVSTNEVSHVC